MKRSLACFAFAIFWLMLAIAVSAQDKVTLQHKAQKGQKMSYRLEADLRSEFGGQTIQLVIKQTSIDEIIEVAASGESPASR
jgi:hypothetical protein